MQARQAACSRFRPARAINCHHRSIPAFACNRRAHSFFAILACTAHRFYRRRQRTLASFACRSGRNLHGDGARDVRIGADAADEHDLLASVILQEFEEASLVVHVGAFVDGVFRAHIGARNLRW